MITRVLTGSRLGPAGTAVVLEEVAACLEEGVSAGEPVTLLIEGEADDPNASVAAAARWDSLDAASVERLGRVGTRLVTALARLHSRGAALTCVSRGVVSGAFLEVALLADLHEMTPEATLVPYGAFSEYVPSAGGLSRLIDRAGPGRAAGLLLGGAPVKAGQALAAGLCDRILPDGPDQEASPPRSAGAIRLALDLTDRRTRAGALTPRQARVLERASFALAFASGDPREGIDAFFDHRPPCFAPAGDTPVGPPARR